MIAGTIWRFGVVRSSKKYLFRKNRPRFGIGGKLAVWQHLPSLAKVFCCEVKFCDPLQKFVTYVWAQATATLWVRIATTLRARPGGHEPRPGGRGAATGGANVDDAFRHNIRNFVLVIFRCHRPGFLRTDCVALPSPFCAFAGRGLR